MRLAEISATNVKAHFFFMFELNLYVNKNKKVQILKVESVFFLFCRTLYLHTCTPARLSWNYKAGL